jgi:hypothetical protein
MSNVTLSEPVPVVVVVMPRGKGRPTRGKGRPTVFGPFNTTQLAGQWAQLALLQGVVWYTVHVTAPINEEQRA